MIHYGGAIIGDEELHAIIQAIGDGTNWVFAKKGLEYESKLAGIAGVKHAIATNSGSSALLLTMIGLNLPPKTPVIVPATNFPTALSAIHYAGHIPVVVDSDPLTFNVDLAKFESAAERYQVALIPLIAGNVPNLERLKAAVDILILDNCDGFGSTYKGKPVETYARATCISSHAAHIFNTGEGGAVLTDDSDLAETVNTLRNWGRSGEEGHTWLSGQYYPNRYVYHHLGFNFKMLELQAAMGIVQLGRLAKFIGLRQENFDALAGGIRETCVRPVDVRPRAQPAWFAMPALCPKRSGLEGLLDHHEIEHRRVFLGNLLRQPIFKKFEMKTDGTHEGADLIMQNGILLPVSPRYPVDTYHFIAKLICEWNNQR